MLNRAAAYIRVSTDEQAEFSPDAQLKAIQNYCKNNKNILLYRYRNFYNNIYGGYDHAF